MPAGVHLRLNESDRQAHQLEDRLGEGGIALHEVVIYRNDVDLLAQ